MRTAVFAWVLSFVSVSYVYSATFEVNYTDGSGPGTLHQAITDANNTPNVGGVPDEITFNISGTGPHVIVVPADTPLPPITEAVIIDGYSQPGSSANTVKWTNCDSDTGGTNATIMIQIDGTESSGLYGPIENIALHVQANNCIIKGLSITNFHRLTPFPPAGVAVYLDGCYDTKVTGCFIGVTPSGTFAPNYWGIVIDNAPGNTVGGVDPEARNMIANSYYGVRLEGTGSTLNVVQGNLIGTDVDGLEPLGTGLQYAISLDQAIENVIGGTLCQERNIIGNHNVGIDLWHSDENTISMNYIGVNVNGRLDPAADAIPNQDGIVLHDSDDNTMGGSDAGNIIAQQSERGIEVLTSSLGNTITQNSITRNGDLGIGLGNDDVTPNDILDGDTGPNQLQNFPRITSAVKHGAAAHYTFVKGLIHSRPSREYRIEIFSNLTCDPDYFYGEGEQFKAETIVTTDGWGSTDFSIPVSSSVNIGDEITSTATDINSGDTSEFSECVDVSLGFDLSSLVVTWARLPEDYWLLRLSIVNGSISTAWSVRGTLMPGPWSDWLTVVDSTAKYYDIASGDTSMGDQYLLDLTEWPGGSFFALLELDYENDFGTPMTTVLPVLLNPDDSPSAIEGTSPPPPSIVLNSHPNPAAFSTTISFELLHAGVVELGVFNARGQRVRELLHDLKRAGAHEVEWDGCDWTGRRVASGVYYIQLRVAGKTANKKQVIIR